MQRNELTQALSDVVAERCRQIQVEGWSPAHDDKHDDGQMAKAAAAYAGHAAACFTLGMNPDHPAYAKADVPRGWPWADRWWKPSSPRRDLVKAAALILAEIERIDRAEAPHA